MLRSQGKVYMEIDLCIHKFYVWFALGWPLIKSWNQYFE
jgi:hypothetical protein